MRGALPAHTGEGPSADVYFEFNFFDGVMVDCKEVNNADWGPWKSHLNPSPKVWDASGLDDIYDSKNSSTGRELRESNALNMESRYDLKKESQSSLKRGGKCSESSSATSGMCSSIVGSSSTGSSKDPTVKKKVQFLNGENVLPWDQQPVFSNNLEHHEVSRISASLAVGTENLYQQPYGRAEAKLYTNCRSEYGNVARTQLHNPCSNYGHGDYPSRDPISLSTGHLDWLWSEDAERPDFLSVVRSECSTHAVSSAGSNGGGRSSNFVERETGDGLPGCVGEGPFPDDGMPKISSQQSWKALGHDPGRPSSGGWAGFSGGDSARCSSMSLTDLVETSPRKCSRDLVRRERSTLASHLQLAGSSLASQFCTKEAEMDRLWPFSPAHSSLSTSSTSKREPSGTKVELKRPSISDPNPYGNVHGLLHCTLRSGLPNFTFLLDEYDEVVTAKIWMEDIVLGEQEGAWRYTFYSLKGDSKKKGRSGWKHWRKKEKLASELVGTMRVSSVLCCEPGLNGEESLSVESEFVLLSARGQDPLLHSHTDISSQTSSSSLENGSHACSKTASHTVVHTVTSPSQSRASSSDGGHSDVSSPGAISAWYVSQSLIPSSLGSPEMGMDGRQKSRKWSLHSGISGMRINKAKRRSQQSTNVNAASSNLSTDELCAETTCSLHQPHTELAAMIINVPLILQDAFTGSMPIAMPDANWHSESQMGRHTEGKYQDRLEEAANYEVHAPFGHIHYGKHKSHDPHRQAKITAILPSGNHGRPLSDMRGPSPLIKRWKEGGKCDCKGWDLGCGLLVLNNEHPATESSESFLPKTREYQAHGKSLTLYRQDSDQDEAYISLAPQESGLIAVDFRAPLSPLQAFAMAVAILHGRGSGVPEVDTSHIATAGMNPEMQSPEKKSLNLCCQVAEPDGSVLSSGYRTKKEGRTPGHTPLQACVVHDNLGVGQLKVQRNEVLSCASELALSFERV